LFIEFSEADPDAIGAAGSAVSRPKAGCGMPAPRRGWEGGVLRAPGAGELVGAGRRASPSGTGKRLQPGLPKAPAARSVVRDDTQQQGYFLVVCLKK